MGVAAAAGGWQGGGWGAVVSTGAAFGTSWSHLGATARKHEATR